MSCISLSLMKSWSTANPSRRNYTAYTSHNKAETTQVIHGTCRVHKVAAVVSIQHEASRESRHFGPWPKLFSRHSRSKHWTLRTTNCLNVLSSVGFITISFLMMCSIVNSMVLYVGCLHVLISLRL